MKHKAWQVLKCAGVLLLIWGCTLIGAFAYHGGYAAHIVIDVLALVSVWLCCISTSKIWPLAVLYANLLVSVGLGSWLSTQMYYKHISSDDMSLVIGNIHTAISLVVVAVAVVIVLMIKILRIKRETVCES